MRQSNETSFQKRTGKPTRFQTMRMMVFMTALIIGSVNTTTEAFGLAKVSNPSSSFKGVLSIYEFTNEDFPNPTTSCGQAAMTTIIIQLRGGSIPSLKSKLWSHYGPDVALGLAGTSWQQMERGLKGFGVNTAWIQGETSLKQYVAAGHPVIVMLDMGAIGQQWTGHWVVAYAYDQSYVYLTNQGKLSWSSFRKAWSGNLTIAAGTQNKGLLAW